MLTEVKCCPRYAPLWCAFGWLSSRLAATACPDQPGPIRGGKPVRCAVKRVPCLGGVGACRPTDDKVRAITARAAAYWIWMQAGRCAYAHTCWPVYAQVDGKTVRR